MNKSLIYYLSLEINFSHNLEKQRIEGYTILLACNALSKNWKKYSDTRKHSHSKKLLIINNFP